MPKAFSKYDIIVDYINNTITTYENARKIATSTVYSKFIKKYKRINNHKNT